jgi:hypothetical protein
VNTSRPRINGTAAAGNTLTATTGTWTGSGITYAYSWSRCTVPTTPDGDTTCHTVSSGTSYSVTSADSGYTIRVRVTATNAGGSATASSSRTSTVA